MKVIIQLTKEEYKEWKKHFKELNKFYLTMYNNVEDYIIGEYRDQFCCENNMELQIID